jgi:hypothetical protein
MGAASLGSVDILVPTGPGSNAYFSILQPNSLVGWQKAWFLRKNEVDALFSAFTSSCPIPHLDWEHDVTWIDFPWLQPLLETVQVLQQKGLTEEGILHTIFSRGVQLIHQREAAVGASPEPSCLICPSFT